MSYLLSLYLIDLKLSPRSSAAFFLTPPDFLRASAIIAFSNYSTVFSRSSPSVGTFNACSPAISKPLSLR